MQTSTPEFDTSVASFLQEGMEDVMEEMRRAGEAAVEYNKEHGDYRNRTDVDESGLTVGNSAEYAGNVEARGYMVCSEGALLAERILNGD